MQVSIQGFNGNIRHRIILRSEFLKIHTVCLKIRSPTPSPLKFILKHEVPRPNFNIQNKISELGDIVVSEKLPENWGLRRKRSKDITQNPSQQSPIEWCHFFQGIDKRIKIVHNRGL